MIAWAILAVVATTQAPDVVTFRSDVTQIITRGDDSDERDVAITLTPDALELEPKKRGQGGSLSIPYSAIGSVTYDRRSRVRRMAPSYGRRIQHFLTVQFKTAEGRGDFIELEMGKDVAPKLVAQLEARSGKPITRSGA